MRAPQRPMDHIREEAARWLASREEAGLMPSTVRAYRLALATAVPLLERRGVRSCAEVTPDDVRAIRTELAPAEMTRRQRMMVLGLLLRAHGCTAVAAAGIRWRISEPRRTVASDDDVAALMASGPTLAAAAVLGAELGLRLSEIARARWCDIDGDRLRILGKGGRVRRQYIPRCAIERLRELRDGRCAHIVPILDDDGREAEGDAARADRLRWEMSRTCRRLGLDISMHSLRRRYGTEVYRASHDIVATRDALGHASVGTTQIYIRLAEDDVRRAVDRAAAHW